MKNKKKYWIVIFLLLSITIGIIGYGIKRNRDLQKELLVSIESYELIEEELPKENLRDKKIVFFGDSVTEFGNYPNHVAQRVGSKTYNIGFGGTMMSYRSNNDFYDEFSMSKLAEAIANKDFTQQQIVVDAENEFSDRFITHFEKLKEIDFNEIDYITIFYGTNDYVASVLVGIIEDENRDTLYGAMNTIVKNINSEYPNIEIIFLTPTWRTNPDSMGGGDVRDEANVNGIYLEEYANAIVDFSATNNLPSLNLYEVSGVNSDNKEIYLADNVHPSPKGYSLIGNMISDFLKEEFN